MALYTFETGDGTRFDIIRRERAGAGSDACEWAVYLVPQGTQTVLRLRLRYPRASGSSCDSLASVCAVVQQAVEKDRASVMTRGQGPSGHVIVCDREPYLSLVRPCPAARPSSRAARPVPSSW